MVGVFFGRYCLTNDFVDIFKMEVANNVRLPGPFVARNFVGFKKLKSLQTQRFVHHRMLRFQLQS